MIATRRFVLRFGAASLVAAALPQGHRPIALAAENTGTDVLDNAEAKQEVTFQAFSYFMARTLTPWRKMQARVLFFRGFADGRGELIVHDVPSFQEWNFEAGPNPAYEIGTVQLDPQQFGWLVRCALLPAEPDVEWQAA